MPVFLGQLLPPFPVPCPSSPPRRPPGPAWDCLAEFTRSSLSKDGYRQALCRFFSDNFSHLSSSPAPRRLHGVHPGPLEIASRSSPGALFLRVDIGRHYAGLSRTTFLVPFPCPLPLVASTASARARLRLPRPGPFRSAPRARAFRNFGWASWP